MTVAYQPKPCRTCGGPKEANQRVYCLACAPRCVTCSAVIGSHRGPRCDACIAKGRPGALVDKSTRYVDDVAAQMFVAAFPGGAHVDEVAEAFGLTGQRIREIEASALAHLRSRLALVGLSGDDYAEVLDAKAATEVAW